MKAFLLLCSSVILIYNFVFFWRQWVGNVFIEFWNQGSAGSIKKKKGKLSFTFSNSLCKTGIISSLNVWYSGVLSVGKFLITDSIFYQCIVINISYFILFFGFVGYIFQGVYQCHLRCWTSWHKNICHTPLLF